MDPALEWKPLVEVLRLLVTSAVLALPVAWNRERESRSMGLRTFPLVAVSCCGYTLLALNVFSDSGDAQARVLQGLLTGMGFIGGGAVLKHGDRVLGTATAAALWATGVIGVAVANRLYAVALLVTLIAFLTLTLMVPLKREARAGDADPEGKGAGRIYTPG